MKKLILALCLFATQAPLLAAEPDYAPDPYTMVAQLQRVIATSTNPHDIIQADKMIREVYGPQCQALFWYRVRLALKAAGVIAVGATIAAVSYSLSK